MDWVGIGDLHFDGPLIKYVPDLNHLIVKEVEAVFEYARQKAVRNVFFYGDIAHRPNISMEAQVAFFHLLQAAYDLRIVVIAGNHDFHSNKDAPGTAVHSSLEFFNALQHTTALKHCTFVVNEPKLLEIDKEQVHFLPWPHKSVKKKALNVLHVETQGAKWETGRAVGEDALQVEGYSCVVGHLHTNQVAGSAYYSGTLYQTNFGEKQEKFFHHGRYEDNKLKVKSVPHFPGLRLHNLVLETAPSAEDIPKEKGDLCKVFVKKGVVLEPDFLAKNPSVVKINTFSTKAELKDLMLEELKLDRSYVELNTEEYLIKWLREQGYDKDKIKSVLATHERVQSTL